MCEFECDVDEVAIELATTGWKVSLNHCEALAVVLELSTRGLPVDTIRRETGLPERRINTIRKELIAAGKLEFRGGRLQRAKVDA